MKINKLNRRLKIYDIELSPDNYCGHVEERKELCTVWAEVRPPAYRDMIASGSATEEETLEVNIRARKTKIVRGMMAEFTGTVGTYTVMHVDDISRRDMVTLVLKREEPGI